MSASNVNHQGDELVNGLTADELSEKYGLAGTAPVDNFGGYKSAWPDGEDPDALAAAWAKSSGAKPWQAAEYKKGQTFSRDVPFIPRWMEHLSGHRFIDRESRMYTDTWNPIQMVVPQLVSNMYSIVSAIELPCGERKKERARKSMMDKTKGLSAGLSDEKNLDNIGFILDTDSPSSRDFQLTAYREAFNVMAQPRLNWWRPEEVAHRHGYPGVDRELLRPKFGVGDDQTDERYFSWQTPVPIGMSVERWARLNVEHAIALAAERGEVLCCDRASVNWDQPWANSLDGGGFTRREWRDRKRHALAPGCAVFLVRHGAIFTAMALCEENAEATRREAAELGIELIEVPPLGSPFLH